MIINNKGNRILLTRVAPHNQELIKVAQQSKPVSLGQLARELNLKIQVKTLPTLVSGKIEPDGHGSFIISINKHESKPRQRFTLAHEIAHFLLHKHLINDGLEDSVMYRSTTIKGYYETEANYLAAEMLLPESRLQEYDSLHGLSSLKNGDVEIAVIANELGVSTQVLEIRLGLRA